MLIFRFIFVFCSSYVTCVHALMFKKLFIFLILPFHPLSETIVSLFGEMFSNSLHLHHFCAVASTDHFDIKSRKFVFILNLNTFCVLRELCHTFDKKPAVTESGWSDIYCKISIFEEMNAILHPDRFLMNLRCLD